MLVRMTIMRNFYRLGVAAEKTLLTKNPGLYQGVVIAAHYLTYFQTSTENFLATVGKPFFVDPMTYVFARPMSLLMKETGSMKATFERLSRVHGRKLARIVSGGRSLAPNDFMRNGNWNRELMTEISASVIRFQTRLLALQKLTTLERLLGLADQPIARQTPHLLCLIPPYFYAESLADDWYGISLELAATANELKENQSLYPVVCISKTVLLSQDLMKIADDYKEYDGVMLWVSGFEDDREGPDYLGGLAELVKAFRDRNKPVYSMYGGYFHMLLSKLGLTGFCSSICYGESKDVDRRATGGGFPLRYYLPHLKTKVSEIDSRAYYSTYADHLCRCRVCSSIAERIRSEGITKAEVSRLIDRFFQILDMELAKQHFMECRFIELSDLATCDLRSRLDDLLSDYKQLEPLAPRFGRSLDPSHLRTWWEVLKDSA